MYKILIIVAYLLTPFLAFAQKPEPIPSFARNPQTMSWYHEQQKAWEQELKAHPKNANAWMNYWNVSRILVNHDKNDKRSTAEKEAVLEGIIRSIGQELPESYEYNFCQWQLKGNDMAYYSFLEKAIAIDPTRTEHIDYMINISELQRKRKQRDEYCQRKFDAGQLSPGFMNYNYNTLAGLEPNAILVTAGDNDTYPAWALQGRGIRNDVHVLNLYLLQIESYREKIFNELGIEPVVQKTDDDKKNIKKNLFKAMLNNKKGLPVYFALTASNCDNFLEEIQDKLYLTGLAYRYSDGSFDNIAALRRNFEKEYALDYIDRVFYLEPSTENIREMNTNYIVPMMKLHEHYRSSGDTQRDAWISAKIIAIAKGTEYEKDILKALSEE